MYGLIISFAILISTLLAEQIAKERDKDPDILWTGLIWALIFGVIGARIYHVLTVPTLYFENPILIPQIWRGGLGIFGGIIGGILGFATYLRAKQEKILEWLDIASVVMPLGQAIGRWGNFFNNELLPYAIYESFADWALFGFLILVWKRKPSKRPGVLFVLYILGYGIIRIVLEPLRSQI